jgi:Tfp pilus assembly protein PilV
MSYFIIYIMKQENKTKKGFSLIEILVALFVFILAITMIVGVFANFLNNYVQTKRTLRDIENVQYAMNLIAKTVRTSAVKSSVGFPLQIFDYSQDDFSAGSEGKCISYEYNLGSQTIEMATTEDADPKSISDCTWSDLGSYAVLANNITAASVEASQSDYGTVAEIGKVTMSLQVQDTIMNNTRQPITIQMSVSLRQ